MVSSIPQASHMGSIHTHPLCRGRTSSPAERRWVLGIMREAAKERGTLEFLPQGSRPFPWRLRMTWENPERPRRFSTTALCHISAEKRGQDHHQCCKREGGPGGGPPEPHPRLQLPEGSQSREGEPRGSRQSPQSGPLVLVSALEASNP